MEYGASHALFQRMLTEAIVGTTAATAILGKYETGSAAAPLNATSHILWGDEAATHDELDFKHTLTGALLNAGAMVGWSAVGKLLFPKNPLVRGVATAALAYAVDYYVVPKRLTPGFEKRLSGPALFAIYAVLAGALAT